MTLLLGVIARDPSSLATDASLRPITNHTTALCVFVHGPRRMLVLVVRFDEGNGAEAVWIRAAGSLTDGLRILAWKDSSQVRSAVDKSLRERASQLYGNLLGLANSELILQLVEESQYSKIWMNYPILRKYRPTVDDETVETKIDAAELHPAE